MQVRATAILIKTEDFRVGYETGLAGGMCIDGTQRFKLEQPVTEELIVEIIHNLTEIAIEGWLSESLLRRDAGMIAGWILNPRAGIDR
jgi:hypothetical protein